MSQYDKMIVGKPTNTKYLVDNPILNCKLEWTDADQIIETLKEYKAEQARKEISTKEETNMTTFKELTLTLVDNNPFLEDDQRIVFQKKGYKTSFTQQQAKEDVIATGKVKEALEKHNKEVRSKVVREDILENTGREVFLKPIKLLSDSQLEWRIIETA